MLSSQTQLTRKQRNEQAVFAEFARRLDTSTQWASIESRPQGEPDLLCTSAEGETVAFELVSLTDPLIAQVQAAGPKARTDALVTEDPSTRIVREKLRKTYLTNAPRIELLVYTDGQIITPDDVLVPTILPLLNECQHPFKAVWFMGEKVTRRLWADA
jgi:hypothetical protein